MPPQVSVIMNCYNGERFLREALDSVVAQTMTDWEVIFWDNGSTDASATIAQGYGPKIKYFRAEVNEPLGAARNHAVQRASGTYLAFLDTDDVWLPHTLDRLLRAIREDDAVLAYAGIIEMDVEGRALRTVLPEHGSGAMFAELLRQFEVNVPTTLLHRETLLATGLGFDPTIKASEEYCLFMQLAATGVRFATVREPLARYRVHSGSLTSTAIERWAIERTYTLDRIEAAHPGIRHRYPAEFREARARAAYYQARWCMARGARGEALRAMAPTILVHPRYAVLFLLAAVSPALWHRVLFRRSGREDVA